MPCAYVVMAKASRRRKTHIGEGAAALEINVAIIIFTHFNASPAIKQIAIAKIFDNAMPLAGLRDYFIFVDYGVPRRRCISSMLDDADLPRQKLSTPL